MGFGNSKGHVAGSHVSGTHTTLIEGADTVVKQLGKMPWFERVRPGRISVENGGKNALIIRRYTDSIHSNTLKLIFRKPASVQDVYVLVHDLETNIQTAVRDITQIAATHMQGTEVHNRTMEHLRQEVKIQTKEAIEEQDRARKLDKKRRRWPRPDQKWEPPVE